MMKLKRYLLFLLSLTLLASLLAVPALAEDTQKNMTLREDWRITSDLDLAVPEGTTLTITGNGHYIYEFTGQLTNSGLGKVVFSEGTILYPAGSSAPCNTSTSNQLMMDRQPHKVTVGGMEHGTVVASVATAKKGDSITLTIRPDAGYKLCTLTVTATEAEDAAVAVSGSGSSRTFHMPASDVAIAAAFTAEGAPAAPVFSCGSGTYFTRQSVEISCETEGAVIYYTTDGSEPSAANGILYTGEAITIRTTTTLKAVAVKDGVYSAVTSARYTIAGSSGVPSIPSTVVPGAQTVSFADVSEIDYYYEAVQWAVQNGVTNGTSATAFTPDMAVTRGQLVTFLWRAAGAPAVTGANPFADVRESDYYYEAVLWAVQNGVTNGTGAAAFSPDVAVTRGQAVTFLWRAAGAPAASGSSFGDVAADAYYANAVAWAVANGITNGTSGSTFSPDVAVSRAQAVTFLYRQFQEG